ncbi:MAG: hypothetical protein ACHBN1_24650 [Heteroscytonema crispum UTEX LB 1556]
MKSFALLLPGRATPVAKAAGKPFHQSPAVVLPGRCARFTTALA